MLQTLLTGIYFENIDTFKLILSFQSNYQNSKAQGNYQTFIFINKAIHLIGIYCRFSIAYKLSINTGTYFRLN